MAPRTEHETIAAASKNSVGHKHLDDAPTTVPRVILNTVNHYIISVSFGGGTREVVMCVE